MARYYNPDTHCSWYDGITLVNCSWVNVQDGCTGTIENTQYAEIAENNSVTISNCRYIVIHEDNTNINLTDASYVVVGVHNNNVNIGSHTAGTEFQERTGAVSIRINRLRGVEVTGWNNRLHNTVFSQIDGLFNHSDGGNSITIDNGVGNELRQSKVIHLKNTNNNTVATENLDLTEREAFIEYAKVGKVTRVAKKVPVIDLQADNIGTILDTTNNRLINRKTNDLKDESYDKHTYTISGGVWTKVLNN